MMQKLSKKIMNKESFVKVKANVMGYGKVGYDPEDVKNFLRIVSREVEMLENELESLKGRTTQEVVPQMAPPEQSEKQAELVAELKQVETLKRSYEKMVILAEQSKEETIQEAEKEAKQIILNAKNAADELIAEAKRFYNEKQTDVNQLNVTSAQLKEELKTILHNVEEAIS
ncbi:DivIVA domain-containing protein (plasmid) [Pontibacillus sp. ALD_SL1]|uniref:DivIVA domain-containing protein n=1 Tax=Pontibacillus sp. ALD_SL1 TaxID=2777185 RepID=UPI001A9597FA|nr:DivIVA domain-containing protein [Pontibacillus sp. ALD_SL1]QST03069.1 DivIVA domain-containing protein [Pontibacillus sp. ALD_SL1]